MPQSLTLIRGLPGSGKSTLAKALSARGRVHLEADQFMVDATGAYAFDPLRLHQVHMACFEAADAALTDGRDVVVANTFVALWEMANYRQLALHHNCLLQIIDCKARFGSAHDVPREVLAEMAANWAETPPTGLPPIAPQFNLNSASA